LTNGNTCMSPGGSTFKCARGFRNGDDYPNSCSYCAEGYTSQQDCSQCYDSKNNFVIKKQPFCASCPHMSKREYRRFRGTINCR
jgi:hypothetical protein